MSSFPVLKWFVILLLPVTLGLKLIVRPGADLGELNDRQVQRRVAEFLSRQHFSVVSADKVEEGRPLVQASIGACRMIVAKSPAIGSDRDVLRRLATATERVFAVYRGKVYADQPTWLTVSDYLWARLQRELGLNTQSAPVLAVVAAPSCGAEQLSWDELG
jgi:hypothetical protein